MHIPIKVKLFKDVNLGDIVSSKETDLLEFLGKDRYQLFSRALGEAFDAYTSNQVNIPKKTDIVIRTIKNDKDAKYERLYEIAFTILSNNKNDKSCQMDFNFEVFKLENEPEACELLTYYNSEYKTGDSN